MKKEIILAAKLTGVITLPFVYVLGWLCNPITTAVITAVYFFVLTCIDDVFSRKSRMMKRLGKAKVFTGIKFNGHKMLKKDLEVVLQYFRLPVMLESDQGRIAVIHGYPSYYRGFFNGKKLVGHREMSELFPEGQYWLISCHNAFHGNYATARNSFIRPIQTITKNPVIADYDETTGELVTYGGDNSINIQMIIAIPLLLYVMPLYKFYYAHFTEYKKYLVK